MKQANSHLSVRLHRPVLILSLLGFLLFGLTSYFVVDSLVESSFKQQAKNTADIFTSSIRDDILNGTESEVYRKCRSALRNSLVVGIITVGLDSRKICNTSPKDDRTSHIENREIYFTPGRPEIAGEIKVYFRNSLAQSILIRIGLVFIMTLLGLTLGYWLISRQMIQKETSKFTHLANLLSESDIDKLETCSSLLGKNESVEMVNLCDGVENLSKNWRSYQNELLRTEKLKAMNNASQLLAHDIKSPLGALQTVAQTMQVKPEFSKKLLDKAIERIDKMLQDIVEMTESSSLIAQLQRTEVRSFFRTLQSDILDVYKNHGNVKICFQDQLESEKILMIDKNLLERAFGNLVKNAVEMFDDSEGRIDCVLFQKDQNIILSIKDNASGLPKEVYEGIGKGQVKSTKEKGSGLGLLQVKKTMTDHDGALNVTTSRHGTEFQLVFPV